MVSPWSVTTHHSHTLCPSQTGPHLFLPCPCHTLPNTDRPLHFLGILQAHTPHTMAFSPHTCPTHHTPLPTHLGPNPTCLPSATHTHTTPAGCTTHHLPHTTTCIHTHSLAWFLPSTLPRTPSHLYAHTHAAHTPPPQALPATATFAVSALLGWTMHTPAFVAGLGPSWEHTRISFAATGYMTGLRTLYTALTRRCAIRGTRTHRCYTPHHAKPHAALTHASIYHTSTASRLLLPAPPAARAHLFILAPTISFVGFLHAKRTGRRSHMVSSYCALKLLGHARTARHRHFPHLVRPH